MFSFPDWWLNNSGIFLIIGGDSYSVRNELQAVHPADGIFCPMLSSLDGTHVRHGSHFNSDYCNANYKWTFFHAGSDYRSTLESHYGLYCFYGPGTPTADGVSISLGSRL